MAKRISIICGHYGSGKTNIAVNMALEAKNNFERVAIADMDIVNPYFRTKDSEELLEKAGIKLICSEYANTNLDIPALPQDIYSIVDDKNQRCILDIGGDDRGAMVLGRLAPEIIRENNYEMLFVANMYRPLTSDALSSIEVMREIEFACKIPFTAIINNSNLGNETTPEDVLESLAYAEEISNLTGLPIAFTSVNEPLFEALNGKIDNLFAIKLQAKI